MSMKHKEAMLFLKNFVKDARTGKYALPVLVERDLVEAVDYVLEDEGYDAGHDIGYDKGYEDGYRDGQLDYESEEDIL
jgi:hypothetical protein